MIEVVHYSRDTQSNEVLPELVQAMCRVKWIDDEITRCEDNIAMCDSTKYRCTSKISSGPRGGIRKTLEEMMQQEDDLRERIETLSAEKVKLLQDISNSPSASVLDPEEYKVLLLYYRGGYSLRQIAGVLYMSRGTVANRRKSGIDKLNRTKKHWTTLDTLGRSTML